MRHGRQRPGEGQPLAGERWSLREAGLGGRRIHGEMIDSEILMNAPSGRLSADA
jgi:hypothetical protein